TDITIYPVREVLGEPVVIVNKGEAYEDPGAYAELDGEDISGDVVVQSNVNTNEAGIYSVKYTVTNADGFAVNGSRTVYVADPTPSPIASGVKTVQAGSSRTGGTGAVPYSGYPVVVLQTE